MSLYQNSVLKKYLKGLETNRVNKAWEKFTAHFHNASIQENIRNSKEEQYQGEFLIDLFVKVFGYTKNPNPNFNLTTELKNAKGAKKTDGAILKGDKALAVIELKGTNTTDLAKIETQAFGYKNNQPGCVYVITSNFEKLRFYIDNAVDFEEFNLFQLTKERFEVLWLCLSSKYLLKNTPKQIKDESLTEEEKVTKYLYKDYSLFRNELFASIQKNNPEYDKLTLFKKTQKLLDRFLFIFFAEDRLLLPPNSIREIINQWTTLRDELDAYVPLYSRFKKYFGYMNTGHKGKKHDIFAYNGGLFAPDDILDNIKIDDTLLYNHSQKLSNYDFESEVSVNILGHIFEHSLNEIEEIQAELEGTATDKSKSKRKKDGVFYTPKYITKYIVDNTVGKLCEEKKTELGIDETEYEKGRKHRKKATLKALVQNIDAYRTWLLQVTICDPACGSGAFLNQALEFLISEHRYIDELKAKLLGGTMVLSEVENTILENNLFGVDINQESVEIAKLSLWLRTAQKGRKLTSLNHNIKCGNSLIDDPEVAGNKAFNWQQEFSQVFRLKDKEAFHIVLTTHNSRTSERMVKFGIEKGKPFNLNLEQEIALTRIIGDIIKEKGYQCLAYNACKDHVHLILVCEYEELADIGKTIKGKSSYMLQSNGFKPVGRPLWSQKFFRVNTDVWELASLSKKPGYIYKDIHLDNAIQYIYNNREKHKLPASTELQNIIDTFVIDQDTAFVLEYKGGFDVVIGNPPYVKLEAIKDISEQLKQLDFTTYDKRGDLYVLFVEKGFRILKNNGLIAYIMPNKWLQAGYGKKLRAYFLTKQIDQLIDFGDIQIFQGATTYPIIFTAKNAIPNEQFKAALLKSATASDFQTNVDINTEIFDTNTFSEDTWVISSQENSKLLERLNQTFVSLNEFVGGNVFRGVLTGLTEAFLISEDVRNKLVEEDAGAYEVIHPVLRGRDIKKWIGGDCEVYLIGTFPALNLNIEELPSVNNYFLNFGKQRLEQSGVKGSRKKTSNEWFETQDAISYWEDFKKPKIMYQKFQVKPCFIYDEQGLYCNDSMWIIPTENKSLLGILNSKMGWWLITKYCTQIQNGCQLIWKYFGQIPIPPLNGELDEQVNAIISSTKAKEQIKSNFIKFLQSKYPPMEQVPLSRKLRNWHELEFGDFLKELKKKKIKLALSEEAEWMQYFNEQKKKAQALQSDIEKTDRAIDQMVYELYGLTKEEIQIVETVTT